MNKNIRLNELFPIWEQLKLKASDGENYLINSLKKIK